MNIDQWIVLYANLTGGSSLWAGNVVLFLAEYFPYLVVVAFLYFAFKYGRHSLSVSPSKEGEKFRLIVEGIGAGIVARGFVELIRFFIHRPRPFMDISSIVPLFSETSYSFPSGHASFFFALSTVVYLYNKRWGAWFFVASTVITLARVMAGVHYLSDIVGGAVLGITVGILVRSLFHRIQQRTSILSPR
ncbi:MAG: hypothetical protein COV91_04220 [Candidatus Taylorbacteria bacterium CG11_big_fil_rev_8_21_14_0_20_46_11]|uniref:Phosphatidic acid phosphatase type 2/haloperoxidase domain-containing protein n=1 Tax=Candidatus Taylorbacteria bacterium CG11_big_fil_rev_8_21_14_0_20_46_11 TaxID=1975025 RepID=A0A2H0KAZ4_9BACT|nr:MAG: hypothetical protein COV91_04220 [Candidatus Taylorbacteria bacterium CG11_big_fil_rev_8_21_14_0_20_46_11]